MSNFSIGGRGGNPVASDLIVAVDNETIFGNGANEPLTTKGGAGGPIVNVPDGTTLQNVRIGSAITFNDTPFDFSLASAGKNTLSNAGRPLSQVLGLALLPPDAAGFTTGITFQTSGVLELTTAQWDAVKDGIAGGLFPNATYYLSAGENGNLTTIPGGPRLGYAISTTELVIEIGSQPNYLVGGADGVVVGMAAVLEGPSELFGRAIANSFVNAKSSGIVSSIQNGNAVVAESGEVVVLTTAQWDAVTGQAGGLTSGAGYYLDPATLGHLVVSVPPVAAGSFQMQMGIALSATAMLVQTGQPVGPHA